jgi:hypothetical protein
MGKGSSRTLKHWLDLGYSSNEAEKMRLSRTPGTIEYFTIFKGFDLETAYVKKAEFCSNKSNTLANMIRKYGDVEGEVKWQQYKEKQAYSNTFEYKRDRYGWDIEKYESYNKKRGSVGDANPNFGTSYYEVWVQKYGKEKADEMNDKTTSLKVRIGSFNGNFEKEFSFETKQKMRDSAIKRVIRQGTYTAYNTSSIPLIEQYGKDNGYDFMHAENGGEYHVPNTVFMVDGYDVKNNVVIEFDEKYHLVESQLKKDKQRQDQIGVELQCKFIRMNDKLEVTMFDYSK